MSPSNSWPSPGDYTTAIQNPRNCFVEADLRNGKAEINPLGMPVGASGNFAVVYKLKTSSADYAVRCFIRPVADQEDRYGALSRHLAGFSVPALVDFAYLPGGIRVSGRLYPVVRMEWIKGPPLDVFIAQHLDDPNVLYRLAKEWRGVVAGLFGAHTAHGDLQHGNILVDERGAIRLVDYDGFYIPALHGRPPGEVGLPNYQHPERILNGYYEENADAFSALVVYISLLALATDRSLWGLNNGENLIFMAEDFKNPGHTAVWTRLASSANPDVKRLTDELQAFCEGPVASVHDLESVVQGVQPRRRVNPPTAGLPGQAPSHGPAHPAAIQPILKFNNGQAVSVGDLVDLSERYPVEAIDYLFNGYIEKRLANVGEASLAQYARLIAGSFAAERKKGLELFLREACRSAGRPHVPVLSSDPGTVDLGRLPLGAQRRLQITVRSQGRNYVWGKVSLLHAVAGVAVTAAFDGNPAQIDVVIDLSGASPGLYESAIAVEPAGTSSSLQIPFRMEVVALPARVEPASIRLGNLAHGTRTQAHVRLTSDMAGGRFLGRASLNPPVAGIECSPTIEGPSPEILVNVDSETMEAGKSYSTNLLLATNAGTFKIPIQFSTTLAWKTVWTWAIGLAAAGGAVLAALRGIVALTLPDQNAWVLDYNAASSNLLVLCGIMTAVPAGWLGLRIYLRKKKQKQ